MVEKEGYAWRLGEILVQNGWVTWEQLEKALQIQTHSHREIGEVLVETGLLSKKDAQVLYLGEILIRNRWIEWHQLKEALEIQRKNGRIIGEIVLEKGFVTEKNLYRALAVQYQMSFVDLEKVSIPPEVIALVPKRLVYDLHIVPVLKQREILLVAISDPKNVRPEGELRKQLQNYEIRPAIATPGDIEKALERYYGLQSL